MLLETCHRWCWDAAYCTYEINDIDIFRRDLCVAFSLFFLVSECSDLKKWNELVGRFVDERQAVLMNLHAVRCNPTH